MPTSTEPTAVPAPSPSRDAAAVFPFRVVGITGTNGKTTTTTMIEAIAARAGEISGRVTTVGSWVCGAQTASDTGIEGLRRTLDAATAAGARTLVVETTSLALDRGFASEVPATVGVFTNLSRDHLDYHGTPEVYLAAKAQLFMHLRPGGAAILNAADPASALLAEVVPPHVRTLGYAGRAVDPACAALPLSLSASEVTVDRAGTRITLAPSPLADRLGGSITLRVIGHVHAENAIAAAVAADVLGHPAEAIHAALADFAGVPGRFEVVAGGPDAPLVVVDYAHTPDALDRTLAQARALLAQAAPAKGRVIVVFGCGGDRDRGKRPAMGRVAARRADVVVITTDNPRSEDAKSIAREILSGVEGRFSRPLRITDREGAIRTAIGMADGPDIVVVAGKGHEKTQTFRDRIVPFDDVEVARSALTARDGETGRKCRT